MIVAGVDPGLKGGIAILQPGCAPVLVPMPVISGKKRDQFDLEGIRANLIHAEIVFVERLQPMPGFGTRNFAFGRAGGVIEGVCAGAKIPCHAVYPKTWQKVMLAGIPGDDTKQRALTAAGMFFPGLALVPGGYRKPHSGIVDALLIAEYGRVFMGSADSEWPIRNERV